MPRTARQKVSLSEWEWRSTAMNVLGARQGQRTMRHQCPRDEILTPSLQGTWLPGGRVCAGDSLARRAAHSRVLVLCLRLSAGLVTKGEKR